MGSCIRIITINAGHDPPRVNDQQTNQTQTCRATTAVGINLGNSNLITNTLSDSFSLVSTWAHKRSTITRLVHVAVQAEDRRGEHLAET